MKLMEDGNETLLTKLALTALFTHALIGQYGGDAATSLVLDRAEALAQALIDRYKSYAEQEAAK